jgi:tetratricopeptide (TPR) repeat protein
LRFVHNGNGWSILMNVTGTRLVLAGLVLLVAATLAFPQQEKWNTLLNAGLQAMQAGNTREAEKLLKASVSEAESFGPYDARLATSLDNLSALYNSTGEYARAEPLSLRALAIYEKTPGPEDKDVAICLDNLGTIYAAEGRHPEALRVTKRALQIFDKRPGGESADLAECLINLGLLYRDMGKANEAEPLLQRGISVDEKVLGPQDGDEAVSTHERLLAIWEKRLGPEDVKLIKAFTDHAILLRRAGRLADADRFEARAEAIHGRYTRERPSR